MKTPPVKYPPLESFERHVRPHRGLIFVVLLASALSLAWLNRFMQDDAFISFVYAKSLVSGQGLTWFGTRLEGYTNFLWVLWSALGMLIHVNPITWSQLGGMIAYAAAIYAIWRLAYLISGGYALGILSIVLFATNYTVSSYATGGLETMLQTALISYLLVQAYVASGEQIVRVRRCALCSVLAAAAILTRLDSALPCLLILGGLGFVLVRKKASVAMFCALLAPLAVVVGGWLLWKASYYGRLLPNSFYAKLGWDVSVNVNGLVFLGRFFHWYLLWPIIALGAAAAAFRRLVPDRRIFQLLLMIFAWFAYIVAIGGDFMEFRFLVPVSPMLFVIVAYLILVPIGTLVVRRPVAVSTMAAVFLAIVSYVHAETFRTITDDHTLDSIHTLSTFYGRYPDGNWSLFGERLKKELGSTGALLAMHPTGAIPYYSGLRAVDMWGLNDRVVAEKGDPAPKGFLRPGHRRHATLQYLKERHVNLVIGQVSVAPRGGIGDPRAAQFLRSWVTSTLPFNREPIGTATVVGMPINEEEELLMWYLTPLPAIDEVIARNHWSEQTVSGCGSALAPR